MTIVVTLCKIGPAEKPEKGCIWQSEPVTGSNNHAEGGFFYFFFLFDLFFYGLKRTELRAWASEPHKNRPCGTAPTKLSPNQI